jgi:mannosyltransferase OCH1-like enzyme
MDFILLYPIVIFVIFIVLKQYFIIPKIITNILFLLITVYYTNIYIGYGIICVIIYIYYTTVLERTYEFFHNIESVIPLDIYQTWSTKDLPPKMKECVEKLKSDNPEFTHHLYDDTECRQFIKENYDENVLNAYDKLIPTAYKADLWRYCLLYKKGGIYLDIKFQCEKGFKLIEMTDDEYFILDRPYVDFNMIPKENIELVHNNYYQRVYNKIDKTFWKNKKIGIYNAVMVCKPNNPVLLECIHQIVIYVNNNYYGYNALYPTGPGLLAEKYYKMYGEDSVNNFKYFNSLKGNYIINKNKMCLSHYPEYRFEQQSQNKNYYHNQWLNKKIYDNKDNNTDNNQ